MNPDIEAKFRRLDELMGRRDKLIAELRRSLAIRDLWPEAFALGGVTSHLEGYCPVVRRGLRWVRDFRKARFVIERSDGERREWNFYEVPEILTRDFIERMECDV